MARQPEAGRTLTGYLRERERKDQRRDQSSPFALTAAAEQWAPPTLLNSWVNYAASGHRDAGYSLTVDNHVELRGLVKLGATGVAIFILPDDHSPSATEVFVCQAGGFGTARVDVLATGDVVVLAYNGTGTNAFLSLAGIRFSLNS